MERRGKNRQEDDFRRLKKRVDEKMRRGSTELNDIQHPENEAVGVKDHEAR